MLPDGVVNVTRRRMLGIPATLAGAFGAAACGPAAGGRAGPPTDVKSLSGQVVWQTRGGEVERMGQQQILIPTFKDVAPNIEIVHAEVAGGSQAYNDKLLADFAAGSPPDVWGFGMNYFG
jgi:ABC-type glycerol-3-phosphate transport system substrate-binding protein